MYICNNNLKTEAMNWQHSKVGVYRKAGGKEKRKPENDAIIYTLKKFKVFKKLLHCKTQIDMFLVSSINSKT